MKKMYYTSISMGYKITKCVPGCYWFIMRRLFIRLLAGFFQIQAHAQNNPMDTLKKYSYYIFGKQPTADGKAMQTVEGTCFFVRDDDKLFLVSAKHLMTSWSTADAEKQLLYPDTLFVRLPSTNKNKYTDIPIDIRTIKDQVAGDFYYNEPDIFIMSFTDMTAGYLINAIPVADMVQSPAATNAASMVHGFPKTGAAYLPGRVFSSPDENITYHDNKRDTAVRDTINYLVKCDGNAEGGYSGAPVFIKKDNAGDWFFAGIVSQGVPGENYFFVVKPQIVSNEFNRLR